MSDRADGGRVVDFQGDGLLWLVNRSVFHPRGFALGYDKKTNEFLIYGDGSEPWYFLNRHDDPERGVDEDALFERVKRVLGG